MMMLNNIDFTKTEQVTPPVELSEVLALYNVLTEKLARCSTVRPNNRFSSQKSDEDADHLLDQQQALLSQALLVEPASLSDVYAFLKLWALDEFEHYAAQDLSTGKLLAYRAYVYMNKVNPHF